MGFGRTRLSQAALRVSAEDCEGAGELMLFSRWRTDAAEASGHQGQSLEYSPRRGLRASLVRLQRRVLRLLRHGDAADCYIRSYNPSSY